MNILKPKLFLILICLLFLLSRLYKINEIPVSVYWDEASIGYNAYSISQTGRDEWGDFFPLHFRAFGEFKLPVYIYATAISVKLFDLNELSVRLPAVLFSLGIIIISYLLGKRFTGNEKVGLFTAFFLSVSPWFFVFSRAGYEVTAGLMFYLLAIYLFLSISKNNWLIFFSTISFILSIYSYNSFRIISPLTLLVLIFYNWRFFSSALSTKTLPILFSILFLGISAIPIYKLYIYDAGVSRFQAVGNLNATSFMENYLSHFNPNFLFFHGDKNLRSQQNGSGQLYLIEATTLLIGLIYILKNRIHPILIFLILISPIPAAITKEFPHALRALSIVPFVSILSALGVLELKSFFKQKFLIDVAVITIWFAFFINYFINFISIYPVESAKDWQYGYKRIFTGYRDEFQKYNRVIISDEYAQPYIFALFYLNYNPEKFRNRVIRNDVSDWGFSTISKFDKFEFGKIEKLLKIGNISNSLIFASSTEKIPGLTPLTSIKFLDGTTAFWVYKL